MKSLIILVNLERFSHEDNWSLDTQRKLDDILPFDRL